MNTANQVTSENRIYHLDTMRYLMVLLVVPLHAILSYFPVAGAVAFVPDAAHGHVSPLLFIFLESFAMEILFFIAGYFALSSLRKNGYGSFVIRKLKRLAIPLVVVILFSNTILFYIQAHIQSQGASAPSLLSIWKAYLQKVFNPYFGIIDFSKHFHPLVYWFLMVLLFFFLIFALICWAGDKLKGSSAFQIKLTKSSKSNLLIMILFGCIGAISYFIASFFYLDKDWLSIGNVIIFRPTRIGIYIAFFSMGIYAYVKQWFHKTPLPGKILPYAISPILLFFPLVAIVYQVHVHHSLSPFVHLAHGFLRSLYCISILALLINVTYAYWNRYSRVNQLLAENSYNIYLIHFVVVVLFQLLFLSFPSVPVYMKFAAVTILSWICCLAISNYFLKPYPKIFVASILIFFFVLTATI